MDEQEQKIVEVHESQILERHFLVIPVIARL